MELYEEFEKLLNLWGWKNPAFRVETMPFEYKVTIYVKTDYGTSFLAFEIRENFIYEPFFLKKNEFNPINKKKKTFYLSDKNLSTEIKNLLVEKLMEKKGGRKIKVLDKVRNKIIRILPKDIIELETQLSIEGAN